MARGVGVFRGLALTWAWVGLILERDHLERLWPAVAALAAATLFTAWVTIFAIIAVKGDGVFGRAYITTELTLGVGLLVVDGMVYDALRQQSLPWAWPAAGIITAAVVGGVRSGLIASGVIAVASFIGESVLRDALQWKISTASKSALWVLAAVVAGAVARRLREAEEEISLARSREEVSRVLHDGVLQTLAAISRRSTDQDLRALAAQQERELRAYVSAQQRDHSPLRTELERAVDTIFRQHGLAVELVVADDLPGIDSQAIGAIAGAVGEALSNAAKHSAGDRVTVYVEPDPTGHQVLCSVRDNGTGFDPERAQPGLGLQHSIRDRIEEIGGRVEIDTTIGRGTEVRLWVN